MYRGTTPTLKFTLPFEASTLAEAYISIEQNQRVILEKSIEDCTLSGNTISVKLTQEETLKLLVQDQTKVQLRVRLSDGSALASQIFVIPTERILKDGVI